MEHLELEHWNCRRHRLPIGDRLCSLLLLGVRVRVVVVVLKILCNGDLYDDNKSKLDLQ